jgi:hypothetical protein
MTDLVKYTLGPEALEYVRERLENGKTLARYLLDALELEAGVVTTFLPPGLGQEKVAHLTWGGVLPVDLEGVRYLEEPDGSTSRLVPTPNTKDHLVEAVRMYLSGTRARVCIFEEWGWSASDRCIDLAEPIIFTHGEEVYYVVDSANDQREVTDAVRSAWCAYPGHLGAMTSLEASGSPGLPKILTSADLRALAERTQALLIGAYDAEAYLTWSLR